MEKKQTQNTRPETMGERIARLRLAFGLSQYDLAHHIGVTRQLISKWESNAVNPSTDNIILLSTTFSCTTDYLILGDGTTISVEDSFTESVSAETAQPYTELNKKTYIGFSTLFVLFLVPTIVFFALSVGLVFSSIIDSNSGFANSLELLFHNIGFLIFAIALLLGSGLVLTNKHVFFQIGGVSMIAVLFTISAFTIWFYGHPSTLPFDQTKVSVCLILSFVCSLFFVLTWFVNCFIRKAHLVKTHPLQIAAVVLSVLGLIPYLILFPMPDIVDGLSLLLPLLASALAISLMRGKIGAIVSIVLNGSFILLYSLSFFHSYGLILVLGLIVGIFSLLLSAITILLNSIYIHKLKKDRELW